MAHKKVLITGSRGIVGSVLVRGLAPHYDIYELDRRAGFRALFAAWIPGSRVFNANIAVRWRLRDVFAAIGGLDAVIHLAAEPGVGAGWAPVLANNIEGVRNIYKYARNYGLRRVIFASTNHVTAGYLGPNTDPDVPELPRPITVADPIRPDGYYATSKAFGEAIARQFYEVYGLSSIVLRLGTVFRNDDPTRKPRHRKTWLSHRDLVQLMRKSLEAEASFGLYYGASNNRDCPWDISNARAELGFEPEDDGSMLK